MHELASLKDLQSVISNAGSKTVVIDFHAVWCGPCHFIQPVLEKLAEQYKQVVFAKCDVDRAKDVASKYQVTAMPTIVWLRNGQEIDRVRGADPAGLKRKVEQHAGPANAAGGSGVGGNFTGSGNRLGSDDKAGPSSAKAPSKANSAGNGNGGIGATLQNMDPQVRTLLALCVGFGVFYLFQQFSGP